MPRRNAAGDPRDVASELADALDDDVGDDLLRLVFIAYQSWEQQSSNCVFLKTDGTRIAFPQKGKFPTVL